MVAYLEARALPLSNRYGFDLKDGWAQCDRIVARLARHGVHADTYGPADASPKALHDQVSRAYGEWSTYWNLIRDIDSGMVAQ
jgi:hypothetical protein